MLRLSIIVPMYNVESYLERCIRSLKQQDLSDEEFEIICIDDGSPDNCGNIIKGLQKEFANLILIEQHNQGVSVARNNGIKKASGKYLLFVDPDDYVEADSFGRVLNYAEEQKADVAFLGFTVYDEKGEACYSVFNEESVQTRYNGREAYYIAREGGQTDTDRMWAVLYDEKFIKSNNLLFLPGVPYLEDGELISRIMCLAETCVFEGGAFYNRTTRPGSAIHSNLYFSKKAIYGFVKAAKNLKEFRQNEILSGEQQEFLNQPLCKFTLLILQSGLQKPVFKNYRRMVKELNGLGLKKLPNTHLKQPYGKMTSFYNNFKCYYLMWAILREVKGVVKKAIYRNKKS